jgi:geranylgeranyl diphosphate synthase, type II
MIAVSLQMGAIIAGATEQQWSHLNNFGRCIGLAFQITDDLLDVQSTETAMGKRVGKDAECGKLTFPGLLGIDQSRQYAEQLIAEACQAIALFGPRADGLATLARYVLQRDH